MSTAELHSITNKEFLQVVFGEIPDDEAIAVCLFDTRPEDQKFWTVHDAAKPNVEEALALPDNNAFYSISTVKKETHIRRRQASFRCLYIVPLDDIGTGVGAKTAPEKVPLPPTYSIETSPGNYQYGYVLAEPIEDLATARAIIKVISRTADEGAPIPNKLIRLPVGINSKKKYGNPPPRTHLNILEPELVYTVKQLLDGFKIDQEEFDALVENYNSKPPKELVNQVPDDVLLWMESEGMLRSATVEDTEKGFYEVVCPWHREHTSGLDTAGYSPIGEGGDDFAGARQFKCMHDNCSERSGVDIIRLMFQKRFVYNENDNTIHDLLRPSIRYKSREHFRNAMQPYHWYDPDAKKQKFFSEEWFQRLDRTVVQREVFLPNANRLGVCVDPNTGLRTFNNFEPFGFPYTASESMLVPVFEQFRYLFGSEYKNWLGFLAHTVHQPFNRIPFALLHVAHHHGTGRGWLKLVVQRLLCGYMKNVSFHNYLHSNYNEFLYRSLLISFDEVYDKDARFSVGERLRELITEENMEVNVKYGFKGIADIYANCLFFSNHLDALSMPDADRRFWCVHMTDEPKSAEHYVKLYQLLTEDNVAIGQLFWWLKRHLEVSNFNATGRAPQTEWTQVMQASNHSVDLDIPIREAVKRLRDLDHEVVWRSHLLSDCRSMGADLPVDLAGSAHNAKVFEAVLKEIGVVRHTTRVSKLTGLKDMVYYLNGRNPGRLRANADAALEDAVPVTNTFRLLD